MILIVINEMYLLLRSVSIFLLFLSISTLSGSPLQGHLEMNITNYLEQFGYLEADFKLSCNLYCHGNGTKLQV
jgi:hypothetical protein